MPVYYLWVTVSHFYEINAEKIIIIEQKIEQGNYCHLKKYIFSYVNLFTSKIEKNIHSRALLLGA